MVVLGISPLDKDATASIVVDGKVLFAAGEERFSRKKQHAGFPAKAIEVALKESGVSVEDVEVVAYPFLLPDQEMSLIRKNERLQAQAYASEAKPSVKSLLAKAKSRVKERQGQIHGLASPNARYRKGALKEFAYGVIGGTGTCDSLADRMLLSKWIRASEENHRHWERELSSGLEQMGLGDKLRRFEHHASHAANSYYASGFDRALVLTLDGYGSGLCGAVSVGEAGKIRRVHDFPFPSSLGHFYEGVTAALGYKPSRHAGKIVGLAAYGDPEILGEVLLSRFDFRDGDFYLHSNFDHFFTRLLAAEFPMVDVAAAYQWLLEEAAMRLVQYWTEKTGCDSVVLSGGVTANVKMNQRIHEVEGVENVYVYPNMGDGGCGTGLGFLLTPQASFGQKLESVYLGPGYSEEEVAEALRAHDLEFQKPENLARMVAQAIDGGKVVARFDGRMEYGPRALGNRSILYHAKRPEVNQWLNERLGRTEFMPFAPVTLYEHREKCYKNLSGAEHTAEFMTITFDCTEWMKENCPAAVHVDGTARPQLIRREVNPGYYDILSEYEKISGTPCLINTSFNMHEEPIVCTPDDAIRAFLAGKLDALAIGPFFVEAPGEN